MRYFQRCISYLTCFLTEDCTKQSLFSSQLCLSLWSYFSDKDISGTNLSTDTDDSSLIQIFQCIITNTWDVSCDLFWSELCISCFCFIFLNMNRCVDIILNQSLT